MIDSANFLSETKTGLISNDNTDASDLAGVAAAASARGIDAVSCASSDVATLWPWVESTPIGIYARIATDGDVSGIAVAINTAFKHGAAAAQILLTRDNFDSFIDGIRPIRDDLFFNKELVLGVNVADVETNRWPHILTRAAEIRADNLMLGAGGDLPDFVGRIYGMLDTWGDVFTGGVQIAFDNDFVRMEQTWRLMQKMRPELASRARFFIGI